MKKYYDNSINDLGNRSHRFENMGPKENDIMSDLSKYSADFGFERTYDYKKSDIIITNSIYTDDVLDWSNLNGIPRVKRMDGIFWQFDKLEKNEPLNKAAELSDHVIFISDYSKESLYKLYPDIKIKESSVILNNVNDSIFYKKVVSKIGKFKWISSATNWDRSEKRIESIINLSKIIDEGEEILLIGKCDIDLPENIKKLGYIEDYNTINNILNTCDAFFAPFFRCAGSKVTSQAIKCGLPVLYSNTGGLPELVNNFGTSIDESDIVSFLDKPPYLELEKIEIGYNRFKNSKFHYKERPYSEMIESYFNIMKRL